MRHNSLFAVQSLAVLVACFAFALQAQSQCDQLFISEYIEGWGNNKAIEIYNPTESAVDLSNYRLERYSNGSPSAAENQKVQLSGTLAPNSVVVCVLDKQEPDGVDFEQPVWDELADAADLWLCPVYDVNNAMYFNGNDAMVLTRISDNESIDIFGVIGQDPGETGWEGMTQNHTLIRKPAVTTGNTNPFSFPVSSEWDGIMWSNDSLNYTLDQVFLNLGSHSCDCGTTDIRTPDVVSELFVYPNPVAGNVVTIKAIRAIESLQLMNASGQVMDAHFRTFGSTLMNVDVADCPAGVYMVKATLEGGSTSLHRVVVQH